LEQLGAVGTGGTKKQTAEMMILPQKEVVITMVRQGLRLRNFGIDFDGII
jgi:hypothetical protein